jgi:hypothetical protein
MFRVRGLILGVSAVAVLACARLATAQSGKPQAQPAQRAMAVEKLQDSRILGLNLVRFINTAEADYKAKEGSYADWDELSNSAYFLVGKSRWAESQGVPIGSAPEVIRGWRLSLVRSADGASYQLMLQNLGDKQCMFSFFSDQTGRIYQGEVLGCPPTSSPRANRTG